MLYGYLHGIYCILASTKPYGIYRNLFIFFSGYVIQVIPHFARHDRTPFRIYQDVVLKLLKAGNVLGKNHHVYFDNFYSSVPMFSDFAMKFQTYCCGTLRLNRKELPKSLMQKKLPQLKTRGSAIFSKSAELVLALSFDRKIIRVFSSIHGTELSTCKRRTKGKNGIFERVEYSCPVAVRDYSKYMGGVDLADQLYSYYSFARKSQKWTRKMFFYLLELMKLYSYVICTSLSGKKIPLYDFTLNLSEQLIIMANAVDQNIPRPYPAQPTDLERLTRRCMPGNLGRKTYCKVCYYQLPHGLVDIRSQTKFGCLDCKKHLCLPECFRIYHTVLNYATCRPIACLEE